MNYKHKSAEAVILENTNSFVVSDLRSLSDDEVIEIVTLRSEEKGKGHGSELLQQIASLHRDHIIAIKAEPMFPSEKEYDECEDYQEQLNRLVKFYERNGFVNINKYIGYECAVAMCHKNDAFERLPEEMKLKLCEKEGSYETHNFE